IRKREQLILVLGQRELVRPRDEHRRPVGRLDRKPRLEEPRAILVLIRLLLAVPQEECHRPLVVEPANDRLDSHVGNVWIGRADVMTTHAERELKLAAAGNTLPDLAVAIFGIDPLVPTPRGADLERRARTVDPAAQTKRGRKERLLGGLRLRVPVLIALVSRRERLVEVGLEEVPAGGEHAEEVAVARLFLARQHLVAAACGPEEIALDERDELLAKLLWARRRENR